MSVLAIFGSDSDKNVFQPLMELLKQKKIKARLEICSAHRAPERLEKLLKESRESLVIVGAGLSAALPGFVASHSEKLVIGLPVKSNYSGFDALLSIHQMPKGFSLLAAGVECIEEAVNYAEEILKGRKKIILVKPNDFPGAAKRFEECKEKLSELKLPFSVQENDSYQDSEAVFIDFIDLSTVGSVDPEKQLVIYVPVKEDSKETDAIKLLLLTRNGLWVGLGRSENAALCAAKILAPKKEKEKKGKKLLKKVSSKKAAIHKIL